MIKIYLNLIFAVLLSLSMLTAATTAERREVPEFAEFGNPDTSTRTEVNALIDSFKATWAAQDTDGHVALFTVDAEWINAYARIFRGTGELGIFLEERLFPNFASAVSRQEINNAKIISIRYLNDDAVVVHMYTDGNRGPSAIEGEALRRTHIHLVAEKATEKWQIVHTAIMDARE